MEKVKTRKSAIVKLIHLSNSLLNLKDNIYDESSTTLPNEDFKAICKLTGKLNDCCSDLEKIIGNLEPESGDN